MRTITSIVCAGLMASCFFFGCKSKGREIETYSAKFQLGTVQFASSEKSITAGHELTLLSRWQIDSKKRDRTLNNYFQYELGKKIKLIIGGTDTIIPGLSYYVPLMKETEREIDCKYILSAEDIKKPKRIIIDDPMLDLNKINITLNNLR